MDARLTVVFQKVVFQSAYSATEIARKLKKPYSTLMRECNPNDRGAKLGAVTLFEIMDFTRNVEPLRYMARAMGYELIPMIPHAEQKKADPPVSDAVACE